MVVQFPAASNVYVADHEASGRMTVDFSRNVNDFAVNTYTQLQPVTKTTGYYREVTIEEAGRLLNTNLSNFAWADGAPAPEGWDGTESFQWLAYRAERYQFAVSLGDLTIDQASWDIRNEYAAKKSQQAMTARTQLAITALTTAGNYAATHTASVAAISGNTGTWAASTTARQDIKRSLNHAANIILQDTLAGIDVNDLVLVMSPGCAKEMSECQEIVDHIKGSPDALAQVRGELPGKNAIYGLPDKLYGFPIVIEKTVKTTSRKGATKATSFVLPDATPFMCARPGGLVGVFGAPSFSTCVVFMYEEMTVETLRDEKDRRTLLRVVENYDVVMTAPVSGFLFTSAV
jgi:hypothetical protein